MTVRIFNTNTSRIIDETVRIDENGDFEEQGDFVMPGVPGSGSEVQVAFVDPAGSMTQRLLPTGNATDAMIMNDIVEIGQEPLAVHATLIDVANPFIFVDTASLPSYLTPTSLSPEQFIDLAERIRRVGAVMMGLASSCEAAAAIRGTPKIAFLSPASALDAVDGANPADIAVKAFSMGKPHPSLQLTGAACLAAAVCIPGTVANRLAYAPSFIETMLPTPERTPSPDGKALSGIQKRSGPMDLVVGDDRIVRIAHSSGQIAVRVSLSTTPGGPKVEKCVVSRTSRRLFQGNVMYYC